MQTEFTLSLVALCGQNVSLGCGIHYSYAALAALRIGNNLKEGKIATVVQHSTAQHSTQRGVAHSVSAFPNCTYPQFAHSTSPSLPLPALLVRLSVRLLSLLLHMATIFNARYASRCAALLHAGVEGMFELRKHYCNQLPATVSRGERLWPPCRICIWRQK